MPRFERGVVSHLLSLLSSIVFIPFHKQECLYSQHQSLVGFFTFNKQKLYLSEHLFICVVIHFEKKPILICSQFIVTFMVYIIVVSRLDGIDNYSVFSLQHRLVFSSVSRLECVKAAL